MLHLKRYSNVINLDHSKFSASYAQSKGQVKYMMLRKKEKDPDCTFKTLAKKDFHHNWQLYIMIFPILVYFFLFSYMPMVGLLGAFQDLSPALGVFKSTFVGLKNFQDFFDSYYFGMLIRNTLQISFSVLVFAFPCPIILALLLNEVRNKKYKNTIQTISYLPFFISMVVICGLIKNFTASDGMVMHILSNFGVKQQNLLANPNLFRPIYVISDIWQNVGFRSILYLAALSGVNQELYEAAVIDGAGRLKQTFYITLPGIASTIIIMLILEIGGLFNVGYEKIILLQNNMNMETSDVIQTFVYRKGLMEANYGYSTAVGFFNSVVNTILLVSANWFSKKISETSLF